MKKETYLIIKKKTEGVRIGDLLDKIIYKQDVNFKDYNVSIANSLNQFLHEYKEEVVDFMAEMGYATFLNSVILNESVVPKGTPQPEIVNILDKYLGKMKVDNELIIVDPFFLAPNSTTSYPRLIENILLNHLANLDTIRIITTANTRKIDMALLATIESLLKAHKSTLRIIHTMSDDFHDRYWISNNREKGILLGTSLNGLGNKLALVDRINTTDVREIVAELTSKGLV